MGFNIVLYALLMRWLPAGELPAWVLYLMLVAIADMARQGFVHNALVRHLADAADSTEASVIRGTSLMWAVVASAGTGGMLALASWPLSRLWSTPHLIDLAVWYLPMSLSWGLNRWCESVLMSRERFGSIFFSGLFYGALTLGTVVFRHNIGSLSGVQVVQIQALAAALTAIVLAVTHPELRSLGRPARQWAARLFHFGKFTFGTNLLSMLLNKADMMLIGALLPAQSVVLYDIAGRLFGYFDVPLNSLAQVYLPRLSKLGRQPEALARAYEAAVSSLLKVVIPVAVVGIVMAPQLVTWLGGNSRTAAADLLRVMALATLIKPWGRIGGIALDATDRPQANTILLIFSAAVSLTLQYLLISSMGLTGAAIAVAATIWLTVWPGQWWISRQIPFQHRRILAGIFKF